MAEVTKTNMSIGALILAVFGGGGGFIGVGQALDAADERWMTYEAHEIAESKNDIKQLKREIRSLQRKVDTGVATDHDKWKLQDLKEELEDEQDETG